MIKRRRLLLSLLLMMVVAIWVNHLCSNEDAFIIDSNICAKVSAKGDDEIIVTGIDSFGVSKTPGSVIESPVHISFDKRVCDVAVSVSGITVLTSNGEVYKVGRFYDDGEYVDVNKPRRVTGLHDIVKIEAGHFHYLALDKKGNVFAWGSNKYGNVDPSNAEEYVEDPLRIDTLNNVSDIVADYNVSCAVKRDQVCVWGEDTIDTFKDDVEMHSLDISDVNKVSIGKNHIIAKNPEGLWGWGDSNSCQLIIKSDHLEGDKIANSDVLNFDCKGNYTVFVYKDETIVCGAGFNGALAAKPVRRRIADGLVHKNVVLCDYSVEYTLDGSNYYLEIPQVAMDNKGCVIIDSGVLNPGAYDGYCIVSGSTSVYKYTYDNMHGDSVYKTIKKYSNTSEADIFIIKAFSGDSGSAYDVIEGIYLAEKLNPIVVNCSISINDELCRYFLSGAIRDNIEYHMPLSNYQDSDAVYIKKTSLLYFYDRKRTSNKYLKSLNCNTVGINMPEEYLVDKAYTIYTEGNSLATAIGTAETLDRNN